MDEKQFNCMSEARLGPRLCVQESQKIGLIGGCFLQPIGYTQSTACNARSRIIPVYKCTGRQHGQVTRVIGCRPSQPWHSRRFIMLGGAEEQRLLLL